MAGLLGMLRQELLRSVYVDYSSQQPIASASGYSASTPYFEELARERQRSAEYQQLIALWEKERRENVERIEARGKAADDLVEQLRVLVAQWAPAVRAAADGGLTGGARRRPMAGQAAPGKRGGRGISGGITEGAEEEEEEAAAVASHRMV